MEQEFKKFARKPKIVEAFQVTEERELPPLEEGKPGPIAKAGDYVVKWQLGARELLVPFEKDIFELEYAPEE